MSKLGMVFCQIYAFIIALCLVLGLSREGDPKGQFVLLQVPFAFQETALRKLHLNFSQSDRALYWLKGYTLLVLPTFLPPLFCR
jgi:hypothetical protein